MANKKFSEFVLKTSTSDVSHIVGYNGAENVQITPANFVTGGGTGVFLPLAGGTMVGDTIHNDNVKSIYGSPGNDLQIYHDSLNSFIDDTGTGSLFVRADASIELKSYSADEFLARLISNDRVELYFNGSKKFETTSTGISVTGDGLFSRSAKFTDGSSYSSAASIRQQSNNLIFSGGSDGYYFNKSDNSATHLRIDSDGNSSFFGNVTQSSGVLNIPIGSAASPSLIFAGDADTGMWHPSANVLAFSTFGSERMRLDSSGNLGLGTSSPTEKLEVAGNVGINGFITHNGDSGTFMGWSGDDTNVFYTAGNERLRIDASGNVGVGTVTPDSKMHIQDGSAGTVTASSEADLVVESSLDTAINLLSPDNKQSSLYFGSPSDSIGCQVAWKHSVKDLVIGTAVTSGGEISFKTGNNVERMRIDSAGNVGIGSAPISGARLTLGTGALANEILSFAPATSGNAEFRNTSSTGTFTFTNNDGGSEKMRLTSAGDLLVGSTTGSGKLSVSGNINQKHTASVSMTGAFVNLLDLSNTSVGISETNGAGRAKIYGAENGMNNVSYCEYYIVKTTSSYAIQQIGTRLDVGNTNAQIEVQISGNYLQVKNVANSSLGQARIVLETMQG